MREVAEIPDEIPESELKKRVDLREEVIFTIDNDDAKDFDDAVGITKTHSGYRVAGIDSGRFLLRGIGERDR